MQQTVRHRFAQIALTVGFMVLATGTNTLAGQSTSTDVLDITVNVVNPTPTCAATVDAADLGSVDAGALVGTSNQTFGVNLNCSSAVATATAQFDGGLNPGPNPSLPRRITGPGGATISYLLREVSTSANIGIDGVSTFSAPTGASTVLYRVILGGTAPSTLGAYSDQVTVTFTF